MIRNLYHSESDFALSWFVCECVCGGGGSGWSGAGDGAQKFGGWVTSSEGVPIDLIILYTFT